jgi:integrase
MATVVRDSRNRSPFWYACYTTADGRRLKKSTKQTDQRKALEMARGLEKAAKEARGKRLTEARALDLVSEILEGVNGGEGLRIFTVRQWFGDFVKRKYKSRADKTAKRHEQMMDEFVEFLGPTADVNIAAVSSRDIAKFRDHRESRGLAPSTLNTDITVLSAAFNAALKQGHISVNPCAAIEPLKDKEVHKSVFTPEQVTAILKAVEDMEFSAPRGGKLAKGDNEKLRRDWQGLVLTAFYTGARLADCANLQWKHVDLVSEIKTIRFNQGKTGAEIVVVVHPVLEDHLLKLPTAASDDDFICSSLAQRKISPLSKQFRKIIERAHIKQSVIRERSKSSKSGRNVYALSFHSLRHSFTSILANAGVSEEMRMALTGHKSRDVHQKYTHHELEVFRAAIGMLPRV